MDLGLNDAAVCVQGGTKGMGRAAAECFAADGARVVVLAREQAGIDDTVATLTALGSPEAWGVRIDLLQPKTIDAAFETIGRRWRERNTLVNAAGPGGTRPTFDGIADEEWQRAYELGAIVDGGSAFCRCADGGVSQKRKRRTADCADPSR
jgi:NAD(P)-dependent dehydrogenase (short-subunit alcohol dehydrogenase family)